jgi:hypothetical protein
MLVYQLCLGETGDESAQRRLGEIRAISDRAPAMSNEVANATAI